MAFLAIDDNHISDNLPRREGTRTNRRLDNFKRNTPQRRFPLDAQRSSLNRRRQVERIVEREILSLLRASEVEEIVDDGDERSRSLE